MAWTPTPAAAKHDQLLVRQRVQSCSLDVADVRLVAATDVSSQRFGRFLHVGLVVVRLPQLEPVETISLTAPTTFPYVPGLLSYREAPIIMAAWAQLACRPDVLLCDGHGYAHPRRCGVACHLGVMLDIPAVGCAKSRLVGSASVLGPAVGDRAPLMDGAETIGAVLRTRAKTQPVYVSVGHRCTLEDAVELVLACGCGLRLPLPHGLAHKLANAQRRRYRPVEDASSFSRSASPAPTVA